MTNDKIIDFMAAKEDKDKGGKQPPKAVQQGDYEIHLHAMGAPGPDGLVPAEVIRAKGFLKFGPQFIAVIEDNDDASPVVLAVATPTVKYIKKIGTDGEVEATLSP